jgi:hypothetical protein
MLSSIPACLSTPRKYVAIDADGIFTMSPSGSCPAFHFKCTHDRTYVAFCTADSKIKLRYWDEEDKELSDPVTLWSNWGEGDDHAGPSVLVLQYQAGENTIHNGKILVATSAVFQNPSLQIRRSTNREDISRWEEPITLDRDCLYPTLVELADGTIYLFYMKREIPKREIPRLYARSQCYKISTDGGTTFSNMTVLFDSNRSCIIYGIYSTNSNANQIHAMFNRCTYEPKFGSWYRDIYYAYYDRADNKWMARDGTEYNLPLTPSKAELVYESDTMKGAEDHTWLSDIKVDCNNNPYLISITHVDYADKGHTPGVNPGWEGKVQRHSYNQGKWNTETISENGSGQFGSYSYPAMAVLDEDDMATVYMTPYDDKKKTQLQKWQKVAGKWNKTDDITIASRGYYFRPTYVRNGAGSWKVLFCYTERYEHSRQGKWESMLFAYPGDSNKRRR